MKHRSHAALLFIIIVNSSFTVNIRHSQARHGPKEIQGEGEIYRQVRPRTRYLQKLIFLYFFNGFNDPYDSAESDWSTSFDFVPSMDFSVLMHYLIYGLSVYTLEQSRSHKSLEAHVQFTDGCGPDLKMYVPEHCDNTVI